MFSVLIMVKKITKREETSRNVQKKILDVSMDLFKKQGFKATTVRQIIHKAGITTGTMYHFFRDKEDILLQTTLITYNEAMKAADEIVAKIAKTKNDKALRYAIIYALEMKGVERYDRVAELYLDSYSSSRITEVMMPKNIERNRLFFHRYNPDWTERDYYIRTLALRGMRLAFIAERVYSGKIDFQEKCTFLIETGLGMFNVPPKKIKSSVSTALSLTRDDRFIIQGYNI